VSSRPILPRRHVLAGLTGVPALALLGLAPSSTAAWGQDTSEASNDDIQYHAHTLGNPDAPVKIEEFSSFTCGHCAHFHNDTLPVLKEQYIDTGKANLTLVDFPLDNVALAVSLITRCAPDGLYWKLVDIYFSDQSAWLTRNPLEPIMGIARLGGMSEDTLNACLKDDALFEEVRRHRDEAEEKYDIKGTPTFAINGVRYEGSYEVDSLLPVVEKAYQKATGH